MEEMSVHEMRVAHRYIGWLVERLNLDDEKESLVADYLIEVGTELEHAIAAKVG